MHPRFQAAFATLTPVLQRALRPVLDDPAFSATLSSSQVSALQQETGLDADTLALALLPLAACCAQAEISGFNVGAIARGISGTWYFGANMEFSGAPLQQTVHAEQSAITHAWLHDEQRLVAITVNHSPCGHCRQFMNELNSGTDLTVSLPNRPPARLGDYLPEAFGPGDLHITARLLDSTDQGFICAGDDLAQAAIRAACVSHAPYSQAFSGVALRGASGKIYPGRYAENAAFNPSLPPLQAALIMMNMQGESVASVQEAVLAEMPAPLLHQQQATRSTLSALGCHNLRVITLARP